MSKKIIGIICLIAIIISSFIAFSTNASVLFRSTPEKEKLMEKSQAHKDIVNSDWYKELQKKTKVKVANMLNDVRLDVISTFEIKKDDYIILELKDLNDFINGKYEGFKDKLYLEQVPKVIIDGLKNRPTESTMPDIFVKKDCSEIMITYKEADGKNVLRQFSLNKEKKLWEKMEKTLQGKKVEPVK